MQTGNWFRTHEDLPTVRLILLHFCILLLVQGPLGEFTLTHSLGWGLLLNQVGVLLLPVALICWAAKMDGATLFPVTAVPMREWRWIFLITACVVILSDQALRLSEYLFPIPPQIQETLDRLLSAYDGWEVAKKLVLFCLLPAFAEEIYFRGFCQTSFSHRIGITPAILLTALLFALAHGNIWYLHLYFGLGYFLGWLYEKTGSLWPPIAAHFFNNTWTFTSHLMGWEITDTPALLQLVIAVASIGGLVWGLQRWQLKPIAR